MGKPIRIAINGFGRIGRVIARLIFERDDMELVATNDLKITEPEYWAYLMKYDSVYGKFNGTLDVANDGVIVNGKKVLVFGNPDPTQCPWGELGIDILIESTGVFKTIEKAGKHLQGGAKKVIITAPSEDAPMYIVGVNEKSYKGETVVSNASCTTNCLAPLAKVIHNKFGIETGFMTTIHAMTGTQTTVDMASSKDWRAGRAASYNSIPASTGAAKAVGKVLPELNGKLTGMSFRIPVLDGSVVDLVCNLKKPTTLEEIHAEVKRASENEMKMSIDYTDEQIVSSDIIGYTTCTYDSKACMQLSPTFFKLIAWYDNERGYSRKVLELAQYISK
ncbi:MAG TPA: type I glyceraldehyde-3-phosphate dehydrogenase [Eubacteriales bacterium]|nr:type I glyceraldehyde-3-phosphate dehydrogenase [Eubacteriales bacterium]